VALPDVVGVSQLEEMRQAFVAIGAVSGGRAVVTEALVGRLACVRAEAGALSVELGPALEQVGRAVRRLVAIEERLSALVALAVATGRFDYAEDPAGAAMATLAAEAGVDALVEQLAAAGVEPR
jgi:hypothetical protein